MAAVGIGTLIAGLLIGAIIIIILVRKRGSLPNMLDPNNIKMRENEFENPAYDVNAPPLSS